MDSTQLLAEAKEVVRDLSVRELVEEAIRNGEGTFSSTGALRVTTGEHTGRSPLDKFLVDTRLTHDIVDWDNNQPCTEETFDRVYAKCEAYIKTHKVYVKNVKAGADPQYQIRVKFICEKAWQTLFVSQLFLKTDEPSTVAEDFTVISLPGVQADTATDHTHSGTFILLNFDKKVILIGGGMYAGELKKSIFSVLNYLLPQQGVLSMHCSCNVGSRGDVALFFGLSGTGKTTLSADPKRALVGDDEHGWGENGVFNIEGGCYAKCIGLTEASQPEIYHAIRFGAVMENVVVDPKTGYPYYSDDTLTENTLAAYPLDYIPNARIPSMAGHPSTIILLTADAFGVLPPISKLTTEQAMYHYLTGYTSKVAGTERGITEPQATFSTAFGAPFLPLKPLVYARLLGEHIARHKVNVYLVNTGWSGGPYGTGRRMNLNCTRAMIHAALDDKLGEGGWTTLPVFRLSIPNTCPGVPDRVLNPRNTWEDKDAYDRSARQLAALFNQNFAKFKGNVPAEVAAAGPEA